MPFSSGESGVDDKSIFYNLWIATYSYDFTYTQAHVDAYLANLAFIEFACGLDTEHPAFDACVAMQSIAPHLGPA